MWRVASKKQLYAHEMRTELLPFLSSLSFVHDGKQLKASVFTFEQTIVSPLPLCLWELWLVNKPASEAMVSVGVKETGLLKRENKSFRLPSLRCKGKGAGTCEPRAWLFLALLVPVITNHDFVSCVHVAASSLSLLYSVLPCITVCTNLVDTGALKTAAV